MASQDASASALSSLSANLLAVQEVTPRARVFARFVSEQLPESAVSVYVLEAHAENSGWIPKAIAIISFKVTLVTLIRFPWKLNPPPG